MALREIRQIGDEILRKKSRTVEKIDDRILQLLDDMYQTMKESGNGIGIAAPQVGVLRRLVVIDVGDKRIEMINPEILKAEGSVIDVEGCLSVQGTYGEVARPRRVKAKALDRSGKEFIIECEGLLARAICHEIDHLDGILFVDKVIRFVEPDDKEAGR